VYHCTPVELRQVPLDTILTHLTCMDVEQQVAKLNAKSKKKRGRHG